MSESRAQELIKAKEALRKWAVKYTGGCNIQEDIEGRGWPCGTCFCSLLGELGIEEDGEHNKEVDRTNEIWRGILQLRDMRNGDFK